MESFAAYGYAISALAAFPLVTLAIAPFAARAKAAAGLVAGAMPPADYSSQVYRLWRAHLNATEIMGVFVAVTVAAILSGAAPYWVNLFAVLFLVSRVLHALVHIGGLGAQHYGPRTFLFVFGWLMCAILAVTAIFGVWTHAP